MLGIGMGVTDSPVSVQSFVPLGAGLAMNGHSITGGVFGGERAYRESIGVTGTTFHYMIQGGSSAETRLDDIDTLTAYGTPGTGTDGLTSAAAWAAGDYGALITILEGGYSPLGMVTTEAELDGLIGIVQTFYANNPNSQAYLLTFWNAGFEASHSTWRTAMEDDQEDWEGIQATVNAADLGGPPVKLIKFLDLMALVYDGIQDGDAPAGWDEDNLLYDTVHAQAEMNWAGSVLIAATVFGLSPYNAPLDLTATVHGGGSNGTWDGVTTRDMEVTQAEKDFLAPLIARVAGSGYELTVPVIPAEPDTSTWVTLSSGNAPNYWNTVGSGHDAVTTALRFESTADGTGYTTLLSILDSSPIAVIQHAGSETTLATSLTGTPAFVTGNAGDPVSVLLRIDRAGGLEGGATAIMNVKVGGGAVQTFTRTDAIADEVSPLAFTNGHQAGYLFADEVLSLTFSDIFEDNGQMRDTFTGATGSEIWFPPTMDADDYNNGTTNNQGTAGGIFVNGTVIDRA